MNKECLQESLRVKEGKGVYRVQSGSVSSERKSLPRLLVKKGIGIEEKGQ